MIGIANHSRRLLTLGLAGLVAIAATACNIGFERGPEGSGVAVTTAYEFGSFTDVAIAGAFDADITIAEGPPTVEVTIDDNLVDRLEVEVRSNRLVIGPRSGGIRARVGPRVVIRLPLLERLALSGASVATVDGSGVDELVVDLSGASRADIAVDATKLAVDGSGASEIRMSGGFDELSLDLSGAGSGEFAGRSAAEATVDLSGGSTADFDRLERVSGTISGGATLTVPDGAVVSVGTSGGAGVERR